MNNFSIELAKSLVESTEQFPVDFDVAWEWLGYSRKDSAKRVLLSNFELNIDFIINPVFNRKGIQFNPKEDILLTTICAKEFLAITKTPRGKAFLRSLVEGKLTVNKDLIACLMEIETEIPTKQKDEKFVYFILNSDDHSIKIGVSKNPEQRKKRLEFASGNYLEVVKILESDTPYILEKHLHHKFRLFRINNTEWFRFDKNIQDYLALLH